MPSLDDPQQDQVPMTISVEEAMSQIQEPIQPQAGTATEGVPVPTTPIPEPLPLVPEESIEPIKPEEIPPVEQPIELPQQEQIEEPIEEIKKNPVGRPCKYCQNKEEYQQIADEYLIECEKGKDGKPIIPWLEELCLRLKIDEETISLWANKTTKDEAGIESLEHPELSVAYKRIKLYQRLRLQQRTMGRFNPTGAIFLLKVNHNMIETEKRVLLGDKENPMKLEVEITEEKKHVEET